MLKQRIFSLWYVVGFSVVFMWTGWRPELWAAMPQEAKNDRYCVRLESGRSIPTSKNQLAVTVQKIGTDMTQELVLGGNVFKERYGVSIVNIQHVKLFENWLVVHGELWNNGGLVLVFDLETGEPQPINSGRRNIAIWCYQPVVMSESGKLVAFVNGYPRNARGVHEAVSVLDITTLPAPPVPISPKVDEIFGAIWRIEDEETFIGVMGNIIWMPDEQGVVFFEGTTIRGVREHIDLVYIDLSNGLNAPVILKERFDPTPYLTEAFIQRDTQPYFFPRLEIGEDGQVDVLLEPSSNEQEYEKQVKTRPKRDSIWKIPSITLPLPGH